MRGFSVLLDYLRWLLIKYWKISWYQGIRIGQLSIVLPVVRSLFDWSWLEDWFESIMVISEDRFTSRFSKVLEVFGVIK